MPLCNSSLYASVLSFVAGILCSIFTTIAFHYVFQRVQFENIVIRSLISFVRFILFICTILGISLLIVVITIENEPVPRPVTHYYNGGSWNFGLGRPIASLVVYFIGLFIDYHAMIRWICILGLFLCIVTDTISFFDLNDHSKCIEEGRCPSVVGYNQASMNALLFRDLISSWLCSWALIHVLYLSTILGLYDSKYTYMELQSRHENRNLALKYELHRIGVIQAKNQHSV